jgi:hypothetical protein
MKASGSNLSILWQQVWGLSALLAAATFSWMAYSLYQPKILQDLGFVQLATWLGIFQGFLGAAIEPVVGGVSDRIRHRFGTRLPIVTAGVALTGLIFVATALLIQSQLPVGVRWIVPAIMTLWVISTIVFRGPVVAILREAAPLAALPQANVILTVVFGAIGALEPLLAGWLKGVGAAITFILGVIALMLGATALYSSAPRPALFPMREELQSAIAPRLMAAIFSTGLGVGFEVNLLLRLFPQILQAQLPHLSPAEITSTILLISALVALPLLSWVVKVGVQRMMLVGVAAIAICLSLSLLQPSSLVAILVIFAAGIAFGLIFESQIPWVLGIVKRDRAGLSTGLYFGGIGAATALLSLLLLPSGNLAPLPAFLLILGALALTTASILAAGDRS